MSTFSIPYINSFIASSVEHLEGGLRAILRDGSILNVKRDNLVFVEELIDKDTGEILFRVAHLRYLPTSEVKEVRPSSWLDSKVKKKAGGWIHFSARFCKISS